MPRNAAGLYTLPDPPRVPNTVIDSPDENATRDDIATELTNSLDRNGRGGMLAPFRIADGTLAAPGLAFLNEPGTGLWRAGAGDMRLAVQGADVAVLTNAGMSIPAGKSLGGGGTLNMQGLVQHSIGGTASSQVVLFIKGDFTAAVNSEAYGTFIAPTITQAANGNHTQFAGLVVQPIFNSGGGTATNSEVNGGVFYGFVAPAGTSVAATLKVRAAPTGGATNLALHVEDGASRFGGATRFMAGIILDPAQPFYLDGGGDTFIRESGANTVDIFTGGVIAMRFDSNGATISPGKKLFVDGGANNYFTYIGGNQTDVVANGVTIARFSPVSLQVFGAIVVPSTQPIYLDGGGDTFIRETAANRIDFVAGGSLRLSLNQPTDFADFQSHVSIPSGKRFFPDGGGDTYIWELAANVLDTVVGGVTKIRVVPAAVSNLFGQWAINAGTPFFLDGGVDTYLVESPANAIQLVTGGITGFIVNETRHVKASDNGAYWTGIGTQGHEFATSVATYIITQVSNAANPFGMRVRFTAAAPNNTSNVFGLMDDTVGTRIVLYTNGGIGNFQANNANISDATVKQYWEPYSAAQLDVLSAAVDAMEYGRYKMIDQTHDDWNHGYIAQNVREAFRDAAPELVDEIFPMYDAYGEKKDLLAVYSTDLVNINLAVAKHEIRKLRAEVEALKAKVN